MSENSEESIPGDPGKTSNGGRNTSFAHAWTPRPSFPKDAERFRDATLSNTRLTPEDQAKVLSWLKNPNSFLVYLGVPGCGKTHFCYAIYNDAFRSGKVRYMRIYRESEYLEKLRRTMERPGIDYHQEIKLLMDDDLIIFDDFGSMGHNEWREEVLFSFIDFRYQKKLPTIVTSNLSEQKINETYQQRFYSRIFDKKNTILDFGTVDWRTSKDYKENK
jgi:DNA replication protein DnaC